MKNDEIRLYFSQIGMSKAAIRLNLSAFSPDEGSYIRFFAPHLVSKLGAKTMLGVFGITFLGFEKWWQRSHAEPSLMLALHSSNIELLMDPPNLAIATKLETLEWFSRIRSVLELLPRSLGDLIEGIETQMVGPFPLELIRGDKNKLDAFIVWLNEEGLNNSLGYQDKQ